MTHEPSFTGFAELIKAPLQDVDPYSYRRLIRLLSGKPEITENHFGAILSRLVGRQYHEEEAKNHWKQIISHKQGMESRLQRIIDIQTGAVDYFCVIDRAKHVGGKKRRLMPDDIVFDEWIYRIFAPTYHLERLKEEMTRSRRYNHALSVILLDIDSFRDINQRYSYETGDSVLKTIVKIIRLTVRSVDVVARYSGDRFLIILPDTNMREAVELAERLRKNVFERTRRLAMLSDAVTVTLSAGQCSPADSSGDLMKKLETTLQNGKKSARNMVYTI